ncbi:transmembrane protein 231-like isoform X2 [Phymastichus coffea]|uniref:transmembrane protein 231-like isoform X2 n=1 Tax=Phymastichus coffea TaxID=108790 RepID=UPI00273CB0E2|nr:transmembrane protein 231-like isoform X2 [Phymastichus coffea]
MPILNIYSNNVKCFYRVRLCSFSALVVFIAVVFTLATPLYFIHHTGGFWIRTRTYWEKPNVHFKHKYFLLIEQENTNPLICSTFSHYKDNIIKDDCNIVKVQEIDSDKNGLQDSLKFEVLFYTNKPIRSLKLLLFFDYELKEHIHITIEAMAVIEHAVVHEVQELDFFGDLVLRQNDVLLHDGLYCVNDNSTDLNSFNLPDLLAENTDKLLSGKIANLRTLPKLGFIKDEPLSIRAKVFYATQAINYRPGFWEEVKWAWMQYVSLLIIFVYFVRKALTRLFSTKRLRSYVVVPWHGK